MNRSFGLPGSKKNITAQVPVELAEKFDSHVRDLGVSVSSRLRLLIARDLGVDEEKLEETRPVWPETLGSYGPVKAWADAKQAGFSMRGPDIAVEVFGLDGNDSMLQNVWTIGVVLSHLGWRRGTKRWFKMQASDGAAEVAAEGT